MKKKTPTGLKQALQVFETGELDLIVKKKRRDHFDALRSLLSLDSGVEPEHRQRAIYALGRWGDTSVVPDLVSLLPRLDESERITALDALGRLDTKEARTAVETCADDPSPQVRKFVVTALRRLGGPDAESRLRWIAKEDGEGWIRDLAQSAVKSRKSSGSMTP